MIWSPGINRSTTNTVIATPNNVRAASRRRRAKPLRSTPPQPTVVDLRYCNEPLVIGTNPATFGVVAVYV